MKYAKTVKMRNRQLWYSHNELLEILQERTRKNFFVTLLEIFLGFMLGLIIGILL